MIARTSAVGRGPAGRNRRTGAVAPRISPRLLRLFQRYAQGYVRRHFHSVRLLRGGAPARCVDYPLVVYLNHASWWDPLLCLLLAQRFFPARQSYGPIEDDSLGRYRFFEKLGFFGVEGNRSPARVDFLRIADRILATERNALWLTPQARFVDSRVRPLHFRRGLGHLAARTDRAAFLPLALEYVFWEERQPEVLVGFGEPVIFSGEQRLGLGETTRLFETALATVQDHLAAAAQRRQPAEWDRLVVGRATINPFYDLWRRLRGERSLAHSDL